MAKKNNKAKRGIPLTPKEFFMVVEKNRTLLILFFIILFFSFYALYKSYWFYIPFNDIHKFINFDVVYYNLKLLLSFKGGYATSLWAILVFISISTFFYWSGKLLLKWILNFNFPFSKLEMFACSWFLGSWICGMFWFFLGTVGLFKKWIAFTLFFTGLLLFVIHLKKNINKDKIINLFNSIKWNMELLWITFIISVIFLWVSQCIAPYNYWDTLTIDMALPGYYVAEGRFVPNPFHIYSYFHQNNQLLMVWVLLVNSKEAAYLLIWGFFVVLLLFVYGWISRIASRLAALCCISIFLFSYLGPWLVTYVKNDLQLGIFLVLQWWALLFSFRKYSQQQSDTINWLFLAGLFSGVAIGHKFTAIQSVIITTGGTFVFFFYNSSKIFKERVLESGKLCLIFVSGLLISWGPWLVRTALLTGNPIYPFLNKIFNVNPLFPWNRDHPGTYGLIQLGFSGLLIYLRNLSQFKPVGSLGNAAIWWGPSIWICFSAFFCFFKFFVKEIRWITAIVLLSYLFSLTFTIKPPYHIGPLFFLFCCLFGLSLEATWQNLKSKFLKSLTILLVILNIIRGISVSNMLRMNYFSNMIMFIGSPIWHFMSHTPGGVDFATIDEMEWMHYLINKYSFEEDRVIFLGSIRPFGIERRHYWSFELDKQPMLYFAEKAKDAIDLKHQLLQEGFKHIIYDPIEWKAWINNYTVNDPNHHDYKIEPADLTKIEILLSQHTTERFRVPSGRLIWYTIKSNPNELFQSISFELEDVYKYPFLYLELADAYSNNGENEKSIQILELLNRHIFQKSLAHRINVSLGLAYFKNNKFSEAIPYLTKVIEIEPNNSAVFVWRSRAYQQLGQIDLAVLDLTKAISLNPNNSDLLMERSQIFYKQGKLEDSKRDFEQAKLLKD